AAPLDMTGSTEVGFSEYGLEIGLPIWGSDDASGKGKGKDPKSWLGSRLYLYGGYSRFDLDYDMSANAMGTLFSSTYSYAQERRQDISEDYWRIGGRFRNSFALGAMSDVYVDTRAGFYYRDTDLRSFERNWSSFGPSSDRDFTLEFNDSDNDLGYEGRLEAGVGLNLTSGVRAELGGWADYRSAVGSVFNPWSGDQVFFDGLTTGLTKDDLFSYGASLRFQVDLGSSPPPPP
ncbi:MAG TPA: hypothetical protein VMK31_05150, partial [Sphingomicrobium sp.]|nr:hypothetical protein [Sphingomicrobium sp.]